MVSISCLGKKVSFHHDKTVAITRCKLLHGAIQNSENGWSCLISLLLMRGKCVCVCVSEEGAG